MAVYPKSNLIVALATTCSIIFGLAYSNEKHVFEGALEVYDI